jgi:hypothetical protein
MNCLDETVTAIEARAGTGWPSLTTLPADALNIEAQNGSGEVEPQLKCRDVSIPRSWDSMSVQTSHVV